MTDHIDTAAERRRLAALGNHTPPPWGRERARSFAGWHIGSGGLDSISNGGGDFLGWHICETTGQYLDSDADAALIAAAPEIKAKYAAALDALDAKDAEIARLRNTLMRIQKASEFWTGDLSGSDAVRYAHENTRRLARAALNPGEKGDD